MSFTLPNLPYAYSALEPYIDEETMKLHHDKHHATYVEKLNEALKGHDDLLKLPILELLENLNKVPEGIRTKVRNHGGGHANHTMFWKIMTDKKDTKPVERFAQALDNTFGGLDTFKEKFSDAALGRFGSGWAWLIVKDGKLEITDTPNQDTPIMGGVKAILGLDVWEHAYYLKYQNKRADYIKAWWNVVNWEHVSHHFDIALK